MPPKAHQRDMVRGAKQTGYKEGTLASLIRFINLGPRRHGLCRWHCRELTVSCEARWEAMATMYTASYIRAASVCREKQGPHHQFHLYYLPLPRQLLFLPCYLILKTFCSLAKQWLVTDSYFSTKENYTPE